MDSVLRRGRPSACLFSSKGRKFRKENHMYDVIIIGAGVSGCAAARELSRYPLKIAVLEKGEDVCVGTSKANSGIIHAGFDARPGSLKAKLNVEGNTWMDTWARELDVPFHRNGSLVLCFQKEEEGKLRELLERGRANGVPGLELLNGEQARKMEPNLSESVTAALYAPTGGIVCPFTLTIALAENACTNGVKFFFDTQVKNVCRTSGGYLLKTSGVTFETRCVINAAGVYADEFHNMVSSSKIHITPRKGEYYLMDQSEGGFVTRTIFQLPGKLGKGVLVTPTVHGNLLVGPSARDLSDKEGIQTTGEGLEEITRKAEKSVKNLPLRSVITTFAGLRAHEDGGEFLIGELKDAPGFFDCAGMESPGLSSAPAVGTLLAELVSGYLNVRKKEGFIAERKGIRNPFQLPPEEREALLNAHPEYGNVICRCESITEGEILDAIHRQPGARSLDGIKRRTRAGMGRCQAGFCTPGTMEILSRELGIPMDQITKSGGKSRMILGRNKDRL